MTTIATVTGEVDVSKLGRVLPHEHVIFDMSKVSGNRNQRLLDMERMTYEVSRLSGAGDVAMVEVTPRNVGRSPRDLQQVSLASGVRIVAGTGWYRPRWYEETVIRNRAEALADLMIHELTVGMDETDIRAGIIGELGTEKEWVDPAEERVLRAAALAHHATGATISLHAFGSEVGMQQLDILTESSVAPGRVVVGHCDTYPVLEFHAELARRGAWVQYDTIRSGDSSPWLLDRRARWVKELIRQGHGHQVLLSGDVCELQHLASAGGHGYRCVWDEFVPVLQNVGIGSTEIDRLLSANPRQALVGEPQPW